MPNFFKIAQKEVKATSRTNVYPAFQVVSNSGLMIKGKQFYALWDEENKIWSKNEFDLIKLVDGEIDKYIESHTFPLSYAPYPMYLSDFASNGWKEYRKYVNLMPDNYRDLDQKIVFADYVPRKTDYISHKLPYCREEGPCNAYNMLMDKLYAPEEKEKIEWAIGSIFTGDSVKIQKFIVLKGKGGTGKSTVLKIIEKLFEGYTAPFEAKDLVSGDNQFAGDAFANNPLVGINSDANLSNVKDNSILNSIVGHDRMLINEKFKPKYDLIPSTFLFIGSNNDVKITDPHSGLIRRIIDVSTTEQLHDQDVYEQLMHDIFAYELGQIADRCIKVYEKLGKTYYNKYIPLGMLLNTNPIFNFVEEHYLEYKRNDGVQLNEAYDDYKYYCETNGIQNPMRKYEFRRELSAFFNNFVDRLRDEDGGSKRSYFVGFKSDMFESKTERSIRAPFDWLNMVNQKSILDKILEDQPAQYQSEHKTMPSCKWERCKTTLKDIDTAKIHYLKVPINHIVIDFDLKDESGEKSERLNKEAARPWPETYAEFSKSGAGIHLHYIYDGDPLELSRIYDDNIEIKVFNGDASLRRKLTKCNNLPIAHLAVGDLPLKEKKVYNAEGFKSEETLRDFINACLRKEHHGATTPEVHFIKKALDDMYESGKPYNVSDMKQEIIVFASHSHNQAEQCLKLVAQMQWCSKDSDEEDYIIDDSPEYEEAPIAFFDIEVFPNLLVICWKVLGDPKINRMINPEPIIVWKLFCTNKYRWVGFNNRGYDNHIIKAWANGDRTNYDLFVQSKRIINDKDQDAKLLDAYNISYTDILDYSKEKMSLKKWEIKLGIHHQELGLSWDQPVPEELWAKVAEYCDNDVIATEAVWNATQADFAARKILAEIAGGTPNMSTNKLSCMFVFENNKNPQSEFNYRFMGEPEPGHTYTVEDDGITAWQDDGKPIFLGYKYEYGKSSYLDVDVVGEGGYVYAEVGNNKVKVDDSGGIYYNVVTFDVASMHPSSMIMENLFGDYYTNRFKEIVDLRLAIKHREFDKARKMFGGKLAKYLENEEMADGLAGALKIVINAFYGMTSSKKTKFICTDERNVDNIVAKRGSLFMINLRNLVQRMGYTVVHCKTDSIKVENPDEFISNFIVDYGKKFGYTFEIEHKFEKICLVNDAVYIGLLAKDDPDWVKDCKKAAAEGKPQPTRWTATGTEFAVPYVYKSLFSHEAITYDDLVETKTVQTGDIYLDFNENLKDVTFYEAIKETRRKINDGIKTTNKAKDIAAEYNDMTEEQLDTLIAEGHEYHFVGRVGAFSPVIDGVGGGIMLRRSNEGKHFAVNGTKGYRWLEVETIKELGLENKIDMSYYENLANDAIAHIEQYGSFEEFVTF